MVYGAPNFGPDSPRHWTLPKFWFSTSSLPQPVAAGVFGTTGGNILSGPGLFCLDFSILKTLAFTVRQDRDPLLDFDLDDTPAISNPSGSLTSSLQEAFPSAPESTGVATFGRALRIRAKLTFYLSSTTARYKGGLRRDVCSGAIGSVAPPATIVDETEQCSIDENQKPADSMKPRLYRETTIPSYLIGWPSRDLLTAAHQQVTRDWWESRRMEFDLYISEFVLTEVRVGDLQLVSKRLDLLQGIPLLPVSSELLDLARELIAEGAMPWKAARDATHVAIATACGCDYLLTWDCRHIANTESPGHPSCDR